MKIKFLAETDRKTILLCRDVRITHGENLWGAETIKKYLTSDARKRFNVTFPDNNDPALPVETFPTATPESITKPLETIVPMVEEPKTEIPVDEEVTKLVHNLKEQEAYQLFSTQKIMRMEINKFKNILKYITKINVLNNVLTELNIYSGKYTKQKKMIQEKIDSLSK